MSDYVASAEAGISINFFLKGLESVIRSTLIEKAMARESTRTASSILSSSKTITSALSLTMYVYIYCTRDKASDPNNIVSINSVVVIAAALVTSYFIIAFLTRRRRSFRASVVSIVASQVLQTFISTWLWTWAFSNFSGSGIDESQNEKHDINDSDQRENDRKPILDVQKASLWGSVVGLAISWQMARLKGTDLITVLVLLRVLALALCRVSPNTRYQKNSKNETLRDQSQHDDSFKDDLRMHRSYTKGYPAVVLFLISSASALYSSFSQYMREQGFDKGRINYRAALKATSIIGRYISTDNLTIAIPFMIMSTFLDLHQYFYAALIPCALGYNYDVQVAAALSEAFGTRAPVVHGIISEFGGMVGSGTFASKINDWRWCGYLYILLMSLALFVWRAGHRS